MNDTRKDQQWLTDFVLELSHRGVSGRDIGDAKASVESHLADSRESAEDAFGDPVVYAQALEFPPASTSGFPRAVFPALEANPSVVAVLSGILVVCSGFFTAGAFLAA